MVSVIALLVLTLAFVAVWTVAFRRLASLSRRALTAFALVDEQIERREELAPLLVDSLQSCLEPENDALIDVIVSRASAAQARAERASDPADHEAVHSLSTAERDLEAAVRHLLEVAERYPELKHDATSVALIEDARSVGNRVSFARQAYNDVARVYEAYRQAFPYAIVAKVSAFGPLALLEETSNDSLEPVEA